MDIKKLIVVPVAAGALLVGVAACGSTPKATAPQPTPQAATPKTAATPAPATPAPPTPAPGITLAQYNQIEVGMNYDQVKAIAGPGELVSQSSSQGMPGSNSSMEMLTYQWRGPASTTTMPGFAMVMFQNGTVFNKSQSGLK